jgi:hypothetical protein
VERSSIDHSNTARITKRPNQSQSSTTHRPRNVPSSMFGCSAVPLKLQVSHLTPAPTTAWPPFAPGALAGGARGGGEEGSSPRVRLFVLPRSVGLRAPPRTRSRSNSLSGISILVPILAVESICAILEFEVRAMKKSDQERGELRATESRRFLNRLGEYLEGRWPRACY